MIFTLGVVHPAVAPLTPRQTTPMRVWRNPQKKDSPGAPQASQWPAPATAQPAAVQPNNPQPVGTSFLGVRTSESGFIPPDSNGDVGPTQVLIPVNGRIKVFDKTGVLGGLNTTLENFFASVGGLGGVSDPHVRYDRLTGRWFVVAISTATTPNNVLIAASSGSTITGTGSFTFFQFQHDLVGTTPNTDTGGFADYPTLGVDASALYIGMNIFNAAGTAVIGTTVYIVRKSALLTGSLVVTPFRQIDAANGTGTGPWTPQGVDNDDPGATEGYFIGVDNAAFSKLDVRRVSNPGGMPTLSGNLNITVPTTRYPINVPAQGTSTVLDLLRLTVGAVVARAVCTVGNGALNGHATLFFDYINHRHQIAPIARIGRDGLDGDDQFTRLLFSDLQLPSIEALRSAFAPVPHLDIGQADNAIFRHALTNL